MEAASVTPETPNDAVAESGGDGSWHKAVGPGNESRYISADVAKRVWIAAGARCTFCNKFLLVDEVTGEDVMIGELAHIVGWSTAAGSPRGGDDLDVALRNEADNLLLMCHDQHRVIDARPLWDVYGADLLRQYKWKHEDKIRRLTELRDSDKSTVVRVVGAVGDRPVVLDRRTVSAALLDRGLFPDWALSGGGAEYELDLRQFGTPETDPEYWMATGAAVASLGRRVHDAVAAGDVERVSVLALARIPLLIALGSALGEAVQAQLYPHRRDAEGGFGWTEEVPTATFDFDKIRNGKGDDVAVVVSVSGKVDLADVVGSVADTATIYELTVTSGAAHTEVICSEESLDNFARAWRDLLALLEANHPGAAFVDAFPAVPITAAITMGRLLTRGAHPTLRVFDRRPIGEEPKYAIALEVSAR